MAKRAVGDSSEAGQLNQEASAGPQEAYEANEEASAEPREAVEALSGQHETVEAPSRTSRVKLKVVFIQKGLMRLLFLQTDESIIFLSWNFDFFSEQLHVLI